MQVTLPVTLGVTTTVEPGELLRMLAQSLGMEYVLDDNTDYFVRNDPETQALKVMAPTDDGQLIVIDDRGSLFLALRQVAACMIES